MQSARSLIDKVNKKEVVFIALIVLAILTIKSVEYLAPIGRDSGAFAYIGKSILEGKIPYKDLWDHKPPGIYYVNALIFKMLPKEPISLRLFETLYAIFSAFLIYKLARLFFQKQTSLYVALIYGIFSGVTSISEGGNLTETYMLLPIISSYYFFLLFINSEKGRFLFLSGAMTGLAFLFKVSGIFSLISIGLLLPFFLPKQKRLLHTLVTPYFLLITGLLAILTPVLLYFGSHRALSDFLFCVFTYNFLYVTKAYASFLPKLKLLFQYSWSVFQGTAFIWITSIVALAHILARDRRKENIILVAWCLFDFLGVCLGGNFFPHYFLQMIPSLSMLTGYGIEKIFCIDSLTRKRIREGIKEKFIIACCLFFLLMPAGKEAYALRQILKDRYGKLAHKNSNYKVANYLKRNSSKKDHVFIWGAESVIYFLSGRDSPTRFIYNYPLNQASNCDTSRYRHELMLHLNTRRPKFIVVVNYNSSLSDSAEDRFGDFIELRDFINNYYTLDALIDNYQIFELQVIEAEGYLGGFD